MFTENQNVQQTDKSKNIFLNPSKIMLSEKQKVLFLDICGIRTHAQRLVPKTSALDHSAKMSRMPKHLKFRFYKPCEKCRWDLVFGILCVGSCYLTPHTRMLAST
jgi:hypothetical protein